MITANINSEKLNWLRKYAVFKLVIDFLKTTDLERLTVGYHKINDDIGVNVQEYDTKPEISGRWESHVQNIDFQFIQSGTEYIKIAPNTSLTIKTDELDKKDAYYYEKHQGKTTDILVKRGDFVILFPEDAHEACLNVDEKKPVRKLVIKVPVKLLN